MVVSDRLGTRTHPRCVVECADCGHAVPGQVRRDPRTGERAGVYVDRHTPVGCGVRRVDHRIYPGSEAVFAPLDIPAGF